ncbi:MAG: nitrous oxide reductase accessory protein NosL [Syntrophobacteraceae bacterium]
MRLIGTILAFFLLTSVAPAQDISPGKPAREAKCPVCGMFVAKFPDSEARIVFKNGERLFFDGAKDLFKYTLGVRKYQPEKSAGDIAAVYVTDYYSLNPVDAGKALYVLGSNVYGPMGKELIPFEKEADAKEFMADHGGKAVMTLTAVNAETLEGLD